MSNRPEQPGIEYREPETQEDLHRPIGMPRPREIKSQKAQLKSEHQHGTDNRIKTKMSQKIGIERNEKK